MKGKHSNPRIRAVGQRCLLFRPHPPTTPIPTPTPYPSSSAESKANTLSFSDYLNRKLHSSRSGSPLSSAFPSPQNKDTHGDGRAVIQESVFKQFHLPTNNAAQPNQNINQGDEGSSVRSRLFILGDDASNRKDAAAANKRPKHLCNEGNVRSKEMQPAIKKRLVVLGDDPKPKRGTHGQSSFSSKQSKPQYNHYENGAGWWDYEREGVDNDEVGANEVWEGMGSTTLGEIVDWH